MVEPNVPPVQEFTRDTLQFKKSGNLVTLPSTSQLSMNTLAVDFGGKKKDKVATLKNKNTSNSLNHSSANNIKVPTTTPGHGHTPPANSQPKAVQGMDTSNKRHNPGVFHQANNSSTRNAKGKPKSKSKTPIMAPPAPVIVPETFITSFPDSKASTLFPKITGDLNLIESRYRVDNRKPNRDRAVNVLRDEVTRLIRFTGTVKLHGQHADVVINPNNTIRLQSRNKPALDEKHDIMGFAKTMFGLEKNLLRLKQRIEGRWMELNRNKKLSETHPLIIAGEWVGPGIQKNVALDGLPRKYFVITSISLNNFWLDDQLYADIEDEDAGIVHIARGGFFLEELDVTDLATCQQRMMAVALEVEKTCPFSKTFGIIGRGEGVVWKAAQPLGMDPRMWVKTKGPDFVVTRTADLPKPIAKADITVLGDDMIERTRQFAYATTTEPRLQQVWQVMKLEYAMPMDKSSKKRFMQYVSDDILREEKQRIKACKVDEQYLTKCIRWMAEIWYDQRLDDLLRWQAASMQLEASPTQRNGLGSNEGSEQLPPESKGLEVISGEDGMNWW
ncbi:hypothetical protein ONS95_011549 [Cadophora gregata]|uniref:uncharacterized protein n=1 Tax=Cadophora gregata TaxID=51156 RepID=UPI0026DCC962|nr:uncharacterized protein ONS95_011549 [Cadophora gregata]KAK0120142.1 hypothetical protein ONS95_011549 [Cadophora gregata]KAK0121169.1 hypothetical protein ONS96_011350 [Cadophora gregata f. sp. sojae]